MFVIRYYVVIKMYSLPSSSLKCNRKYKQARDRLAVGYVQEKAGSKGNDY